MKSLFPNQEWTDYVLKEIVANGLDEIAPADALEFRIDGTAESWVHLMAAMAKRESNFNPKLTYNESGHLQGVISTGLFQLSYRSVRGYAKFGRSKAIREQLASATTQKLKNPLFNIRAATTILQRWVGRDGVIATESSPWLGGARYWSVLRKGARKVKATLEEIYTSIAPPEGIVASGLASRSEGEVREEVAWAYRLRNELGSNCNWIFEVDYSINSRYPRFFVYSIRDRKLYKYKCAYGIGGENRVPHDGRTREVSNVPNSNCSSLGVIRTGARYDSDVVGEALRLHGLSPSNSKILARGVVLHGGAYVEDNKSNSNTEKCGRSHGCIVVDDRFIDRDTGGELLEWLRDGSIGVAHYKGAFEIPG